MQGDGRVEPFIIRRNNSNEHSSRSYWYSVVQSLLWRDPNSDEYELPDFIIDPDGIA